LPAPEKPPRKLCDGQALRDAPEGIDASRNVDGAELAPLRYGPGEARWVWVNVWAAWCKPCKEEMPLLLAWRDKLRKGGVKLELAFVSIDDDDREMKRFLSSQPRGAVRASYWLAEEKEREAWFASVGFDDQPQLPVHALVRPDGKLACTITGALQTSDYPALEALFGG
jgi:thiol-disulfide isomerase/thioredoxin